MLGKRGREGWDMMEASPFFICCYPLSEHHCSSDDKFGFDRTRIEKALWESYPEPIGRCGPDCVQRGALGHYGDQNPQFRVRRPRTRESKKLTWGHTTHWQ